MQHRLTWACWTQKLLALTGLNGGFLIQSVQPGASTQECLCLAIGFEHRTSPLQEGLGVMDVLPGMIAPGTDSFGFEPAANRTCTEARKRRGLGEATCQLGSAPTRQRHLALFGQTTGDGGDLRAHLRGKNASAPRCEARRQVNGS